MAPSGSPNRDSPTALGGNIGHRHERGPLLLQRHGATVFVCFYVSECLPSRLSVQHVGLVPVEVRIGYPGFWKLGPL